MPRRVPTYRPPYVGPAASRKAYEAQAGRREDDRFYCSRPWRVVRRLKLDLNPLCEECEAKGLIEPATQVHHVKERRDYPELALDLDNLQSLCLACHNGKRKAHGKG